MILGKTENVLGGLLKKKRKDPRREYLMGVLGYTFLFLIIGVGTLGKIIYRSGTLVGEDGSAQYFSMVLDFRRNVLSLLQSLTDGNFKMKMLSFEFMFGSDVLTTSSYFVLPFLPLYFLSVFVPEEFLPAFFAFVVVLLSYLSGICNIIMCRHFKANVLWSCFFSPAYVFCGSYYYTIVWNPQFLSMMIVFPLMIIGVDRILSNKSGLLFVLCIAHLGLYGVTLLIYTVPFVVLFAIAKFCFVNRRYSRRSIFKYFLKSVLYLVTGLALSAFFLFPFLYTLSNSYRRTSLPENIFELLVPSAELISDTLYCYDINRPVGLWPVLLPFLMYCVFSVKSEKLHKFISAGSLVVISLPVMWCGLNGFMYTLCRWGFVLSCLFSYIASYYAPVVFRLPKKKMIALFLGITLFLISIPFGLEYFFLIIATVGAVVTSFPVSLEKAVSLLRKAKVKYNNINSKIRHYLNMLALIVLVTALLMLAVILIMSPYYNVSKGVLCVSISLGILVLIQQFASKIKESGNLLPVAGVILFSVSTAVYMVTARSEYDYSYNVRSDPFYAYLSDYNTDSEGFDRFISINSEKERYVNNSSFDYRKKSSETLASFSGYEEVDVSERNKQVNLALKYGLTSAELFSSTIDSDYLRFLGRCGMDQSSLGSLVDTFGYINKEAIYSLMGVKYMYSDYDSTSIYGVVPDDKFSYKNKFLFVNKYVLPVGVTYDNLISKEQFDCFNSAELPYAMMNSVYLENEVTECGTEKIYSRSVAHTHERKIRENLNQYYDFTDNKITINEDVSGGFVYLDFTGVDYRSLPDVKNNDLHIAVDDKDEIISLIVNNDSNWPWLFPRNHYTISLGFCKETIHTIEFMAFFDFDDVDIIYVPESVYTEGYEKITEETLENVELGTNTLTGDITVSSDKVLSINLLHNDGWTAYVDEVKTPIYKANGLFLGIKLKEGTHKIRLVYRTPFLYEGMTVSFVTLIILVAKYIILKKKKCVIRRCYNED